MGLISIDPGRLDEVLTLKEPVKVIDGTTNNETITYATAGTVRAERMYKSSTEKFEAGQQVGVDVQDFRIRDVRSLYAITNQWRFTWRGVEYSVTGIEPSGRKNYLILHGQARDNG